MKKILSLVLAMLMIFSMVPAVFAAETSESDYQAAIDYLSAIALWKGYGDGEDGADDQVLRYQMALFTARMVTGRVDKAYWETDANDSDFTDLEALDAEALGGVCYAAQQGIVNGIGGSEFAPFDNVTYRDAIVMIVRALGFNYPASGYPWSYINKARELGVLDGITGVSYTAEVKREVVAQLLYNAINAEIKGETIAASVFGVEETIVMVTATPDGIVYKADGAKSVKANMVRVSAVDAEGEPIGAEYYVPFKELGLKKPEDANAAVGAYFKLTHKGNFSDFLACESLTQVFENTPDKKEVKYDFSNANLTLGGKSYLVLKTTDDYSSLTNNQGTVSGSREIKVFKAWGANNAATVGAAGYYLAADGKVYSYANPFYPYAIKSDITDTWFKVTVNDHGGYTYQPMDENEVKAMLATVGGTVKGFSEIGRDGYVNTKVHKDYGAQYDYYKAFATDTDGDGEFERVTVRAYRLYKFVKGVRDGKNSSGSTTEIDTFTLYKFGGNGLTANMNNEQLEGTWDAEYSYDYGQGTADYEVDDYKFFRFTGVAYNKLPSTGIIVAYFNSGVESEQEIEVVAVADKMSAYIRGYDQASDSIIYGSDYETKKLGYFGVAGTSIYRATQCGDPVAWKVNAANYVRQYWNEYVDLYVLNDSVVYIDNNDNLNDYVILESYTGFSEEGLTAVAYSTKAGGKTEILISELNGWQLGGFDYALYEEMLRLQALGLNVQINKLPVRLNQVYAVRYVNENGAYNLINPSTPKEKSIFVNNYGYIVGVDKNGDFGDGKRVATSDKDLWFIITEDDGKVYPFQGKLAPIAFTNAKFYKAENNQFVLSVANADALDAIMGNTMDGIEYYMYSTTIDNAYRNENIFGTYYYGHAMLNMRTGNVEFITYDPVYAAQLNEAGKWNEGRYIGLDNGDIFKTIGGVLKDVETTYEMDAIAKLEFAKGSYEGRAPKKVAVGSVLPAGVEAAIIDDGSFEAAYVSYDALRNAITDTLYKGVYNDGFHNTSVSYREAIKLELAHNVKFVERTATARKQWVAASNNKYVDYYDSKKNDPIVLGSDTKIAIAYVMYDFENASATVYVDSKTDVPLIDHDEFAKENILPGVNAIVAFDSNIMKDETAVTVKFSKPAAVTDVTVAGKEISNKWIGSNSVTFTVPVAGFLAVNDIAVAGTALNLDSANRVSGMTLEGVYGCYQPDGYAPSSFAFDGVIKSTAFNGATGTWAYRTQGFDTVLTAPNTPSANEVAHPLGGYAVSRKLSDGYYYDSVVIKVADTPVAKLDALSVVLNTSYSGGDTRMLIPGYDVLVSSDGVEWRTVCKGTDLVAKGEWTALELTADLTASASVANFALKDATNVKYIALAKTHFGSHGDANQASFTFVVEISAYAPAANLT